MRGAGMGHAGSEPYNPLKPNPTRRHMMIAGGSALAVAAIATLARTPGPRFVPAEPEGVEDPDPFARISAHWPTRPPLGLVIDQTNLEDVSQAWANAGVSWETMQTPPAQVPPVFVAEMLQGLVNLRSEERKAAFFLMMTPHIVLANHLMGLKRQRLMHIHQKGANVTPGDLAFVLDLAERLRVEDPLGAAGRAELLKRVDVIPTSLALAQAATESGWGTSRFARQGNALFGVWTWSESAGIIPNDRVQGATHAVKAYESLLESVTHYMDNLNRHAAYEELRQMRANYRAQGTPPEGSTLAGGLIAYSERREVYVEELRSIIRVNNLAQLDAAVLAVDPNTFTG